MAGKNRTASPEVAPKADLESDDEVQLLSPPLSKSKKAHPSDLVLCAIFSRLTDHDLPANSCQRALTQVGFIARQFEFLQSPILICVIMQLFDIHPFTRLFVNSVTLTLL